MKKIILILTITMFMLGFTSCGGKPETTVGETEVPLIDCSGVQTDVAIDDYFGGSLEETVKQLEPLLVPALSLYAQDGVTVFTGGADDDLDLKWQIVIAQISNYVKGEPVEADGGGQNYIVSEATVGEYFNSSFAGNTEGAPEISEIFRDLYSGKTGEYTIPVHLELPVVYGAMKSVSLSKGNSAEDSTMSATMDYVLTTPLDGDANTPFGEMSIEIVKNPQSIYGYSLQSLSFTKIK